jgi:ribosomal protein S18 acetylase RimI-like enzyme
MRYHEIMTEAALKGPYIHAHMSGEHAVWIDMMSVPSNQRGKGVGRRYYEKWESELPKTVALVLLVPADTGSGSGPSNGFWEAMGYEYRDNECMWKGVNGHPTPAGSDPNPDDEEPDPDD